MLRQLDVRTFSGRRNCSNNVEMIGKPVELF
jgi:hypothetical protein